MAGRCISVTFNAADCDQIGLSNPPPAPQIAAAKRLSARAVHCRPLFYTTRAFSAEAVGSIVIMQCNQSKWGREGLGTAGGGTLAFSRLCQKLFTLGCSPAFSQT